MAVATYYSDTIMQPARAVHAGLNVSTGVVSTGATAGTIGDIMVICKIPHGAIIMDAQVEHNSPASVQCTKIGRAHV